MTKRGFPLKGGKTLILTLSYKYKFTLTFCLLQVILFFENIVYLLIYYYTQISYVLKKFISSKDNLAV